MKQVLNILFYYDYAILQELYKVSKMSFIKVYIKMTTSARLFLSHDFLACTNKELNKVFTGFLHVVRQVILD